MSDDVHTFLTSDGNGAWGDLRLDGAFSETFLTGDPLVVKLEGDETVENAEFTYQIHQFAGMDGYRNTLLEYDRFEQERYGKLNDLEVDTVGLEEVASIKTKLFKKDADRGSLYAILPSTLPQGYFVVTISGKDTEGKDQFAQKLIQIRNISAYTQSLNGETMVWLNSPESGKSMAGAKVILTDREKPEIVYEGITGEDGIAKISTDQLIKAYLTVEDDARAIYFAPVDLNYKADMGLREKYYSALFTDREIYQPTDAIRLWGALRPRSEDWKLPEAVYAELALSGGQPLYKVKLAVKPDGTFEGQIKYESLRADDYFYLRLTDGKGESFYFEKHLPIKPYTKPAYVIDIQPEKSAFYADEPVKLRITATYFDGTPVAGGKLQINANELLPEPVEGLLSADGLLTLDQQGKGTYTGRYQRSEYMQDSPMDWSPDSLYIQVTNADAQDVEIWKEAFVTILPSRVAAKLEPGSGKGEMILQTAQVDVSRLDTDEEGRFSPNIWWLSDPYDRVAGAPRDVSAVVEVNSMEFRQVPTGSYYDYINKRTITTYQVEVVYNVARTVPVQTKDGKAVITGLPYETPGKDIYYWYTVRLDGGVEGIGAVQEEYRAIWAWAEMPDASLQHYSFADNREGAKAITAAAEEPIPLGLFNNGVQTENRGVILYSAFQNQMLETGLFSDQVLTIPMKKAYLPQIFFAGAYFDGRHIFSIDPLEVTYNFEEKTLKLDLATDKETYGPGEKAKVILTVTDAQGKPAAASACVGVVDEAVFAIADQKLELVKQVYERVFSMNLTQNVSYIEYNLDEASANMGGGGGGGDDGGSLRENFIDTALFQAVEVGPDGKGTVEVTLPDNVTAWRVTAAAVTADLDAGDEKKVVEATMPFYLRPLLTEAYLVGDDLALSLQGVGRAVKANDPISYQVTLENSAGNALDSKTLSGKVGIRTPLSFGKQPEGAYFLTIEGSTGEYSDAVKLPVAVLRQGVTVPLFKTIPLDEVNQLESALYPVNLTVYDERMEPFMTALQNLSGMDGERTELLAASYQAKVLLNGLLDGEARGEVSWDARLDDVQPYGEGVRALPNGQPDVGVTARMLAAVPTLVNTEYAKNLLKNESWEKTAPPDDVCMTMLGMAALDEPVLLDLRQQLSDNGTLTVSQRMYLGAGLALLGDLEGAKSVYQGLGDTLVAQGTISYVEGKDGEERLQNTAAALMLTSLAKHSDADRLMRWLNKTESVPESGKFAGRMYCGLEPYTLEVLTYVQNFNLTENGELGKFRYTLLGKTEEASLKDGYKTLSLSAEGLRDAGIKSLSGKLMAGVHYTGYGETAKLAGGGLLAVKKTYTPLEGTLAVNQKARVDIRVTFDPSAPAGVYRVSDYVPSGMRYMTFDESGYGQQNGSINPYTPWLSSEIGCNKQQVSGLIYRNGDTPDPAKDPAVQQTRKEGNMSDEDYAALVSAYENRNTYTITYYLSGAIPGTFVTEGVVITSDFQGGSAHGEGGTIFIS